MKVLILHISDLHINCHDNINPSKIDKLIDALETLDKFDECMIICSGDIANRGYYNDYKRAKYLFGNLINKIKSRFSIGYIKLFVVPGNHDANFTNVNRDCNDILSFYKNNSIEQQLSEEVDMFKEFYEYASSNTDSLYKKNKIVDVKLVNYKGFLIQVNLINTAPFSTLLPNDKELHYFPERYLGLIERKYGESFVITVMHHSIDNFNWESKVKLDEFISNNSSILLLGHDHYSNEKNVIDKSGRNMIIFSGGKCDLKDFTGESEFNTIILDTGKKLLSSYSFRWDIKSNIYIRDKCFINKSFNLYNNIMNPKQDYIRYLNNDEKHQICSDFTKYFVFPSLKLVGKKDYSEKKYINDIDTFLKELNEKKRVNVVGGENSGKTAFLKFIYLSLLASKIPLFFTIDDIRDKEVDKIIKPLFEEQYSEKHTDFERFLQTNKFSKVAIIDDIDKIKSPDMKDRFIKRIKEKFEYIIYSSKDEIELNIVDNIQSQIDSKNEIITYKIDHFYLEKRTELIRNVCKAYNDLNDYQINNIISKINNYIHSEIKVFELNPDFIIQYVNFFIKETSDSYLRNDIAFNKIFETNINNSIIKNTKANLVEKSFTILEELAYYIHFNKRYPISIQEFETIVDNYNSDYLEEVNSRELLDMLIKSKIIQSSETNFTLRFSNINYLAFFVAKSLKRKYNESHSSHDLENILRNICFDINSHIMLFYSYLDSNKNIIMYIYNNSESLMEKWNLFKLHPCNINFLNDSQCLSEVKAPGNNEKQRIKKIQDEAEMEAKNKQIIECRDIYDYDEEEVKEFSFQLKSAFKYTEFLVKALPSLGHMLKKEEKLKLIRSILENPSKIIYKLLNSLDADFEELIEEILSFTREKALVNSSNKEYDKDSIKRLFIDNAICLILNIYNNFANILSDANSQRLIESNCNDNINDDIFNIMIIENCGYTDELLKKIDEILTNTNNKVIRNMTLQIIRKHLIFNENIKFNRLQSIVDKYFKYMDNNEKKSILIQRSNKKIS